FAETASEAAFHAKEQLNAPGLETLLELDDAAFRIMFAGSPVKRSGRDRFIRNVLIAAGNSGEARLCGKILPLLDDGSALVRAMAVWALSELGLELGDPDIWSREKARRSGLEDDPDVLAEWRAD
ncbi:MAG: epoxyqueuosine reductase, partial [Sphingomonadales bacterium]